MPISSPQPTRERDARLSWPRVMLSVTAVTAVALVLSSHFKDDHGLPGAVAWIAWITFWAGLIALLGLAMRGMVGAVRRRRATVVPAETPSPERINR